MSKKLFKELIMFIRKIDIEDEKRAKKFCEIFNMNSGIFIDVLLNGDIIDDLIKIISVNTKIKEELIYEFILKGRVDIEDMVLTTCNEFYEYFAKKWTNNEN